ncbi:cupin domain-containing protein [Nocardia sp. NPDC004123]
MENHRRDIPNWYNIGTVEWGAVRGPRIANGVDGKLISRSEDADGSATLLLELPAGWRFKQPAETGTLEIFVTAGGLSVDGERVGTGGFVAVPSDCGTVELSSESGAQLLVFWNPQFGRENCYPDGVPQRRDTWSEPWLPVDVPGMHGVFYKPLRFPFVGNEGEFGSDCGSLVLLCSLPGVCTADQEHHEDTWEELLCLSGDLFFAGRGLGDAGTVINNPAWYEHGPYGTQRGQFAISQALRPLTINLTHRPGGPQAVEHYRATNSLFAPLLTTETWATRPEAGAMRDFAAAEVGGR